VVEDVIAQITSAFLEAGSSSYPTPTITDTDPPVTMSNVDHCRTIFNAHKTETNARTNTYISYYNLGRKLHHETEAMAVEKSLDHITAARRTAKKFTDDVVSDNAVSIIDDTYRRSINTKGTCQPIDMKSTCRQIAKRARKIYELIGERRELIGVLANVVPSYIACKLKFEDIRNIYKVLPSTK
jgi:hypothetical protein